MIRYIVKSVYLFIIDHLPDYAAVNLMYFRHFRRLPNLKSPKTFNEKIAWRKLYQHNPLFHIFSDKVASKKEIAKLIGEQHVIETLWVGNKPEDIPFDDIKPPYVIKVNHSSGGSIFIRVEQDIDRVGIIDSMNKQLLLSHGRNMFREWGYCDIPRKVLIERMIEMPSGDVPEDYKFFVYHGRVYYIQVDYDRFKEHKRNLYDREWNLLSCKLMHPTISTPVSKPADLSLMVNIAEKVGYLFDFARVDLYSTPKGILFGEVTFYPGAGLERFTPNNWDDKFGEPWRI
jgi:hypothetical protein